MILQQSLRNLQWNQVMKLVKKLLWSLLCQPQWMLQMMMQQLQLKLYPKGVDWGVPGKLAGPGEVRAGPGESEAVAMGRAGRGEEMRATERAGPGEGGAGPEELAAVTMGQGQGLGTSAARAWLAAGAVWLFEVPEKS